MIHWVHGDILDSNCNYICQQVNCRGVMGSGLAKQIRDRWPQVYENYRAKYAEAIWNRVRILGDIQICALYEDYNKTDFHQHVVNFFSQDGYGNDGRRYTSYDAFWNCLHWLNKCAGPDATIAIPYNIGCGLGGGNWEVIYTMIEEVLSSREIYIYYRSEVDLPLIDKKRAGIR